MCYINVDGLKKCYRKEVRGDTLKDTIKSLFKREYKEIKALNGISFTVEKGEMVGIIGPNGAGKTTLLKILSGVLYPDEGNVTIDGFVPWERKETFLNRISFFMGQRGFLGVTVWDIPPVDGFRLIKEIYGIDEESYGERVERFSEILNVTHLLKTPLRKLSLGERTKVELIASLLHLPEFILLDEPTIGMDVISQKRIWDFLKEYNNETGATILITSHYTRDLEELGKRIMVLHKGKILFDGEKKQLQEKVRGMREFRVRCRDRNVKLPVEVYRWEEDTAVFNVPDGEVKKIAFTIAGIDGVIDIHIEDPAFEDVIRRVFKEADNEEVS